jgi:hypothetical protein
MQDATDLPRPTSLPESLRESFNAAAVMGICGDCGQCGQVVFCLSTTGLTPRELKGEALIPPEKITEKTVRCYGCFVRWHGED